MCGKGQMMNGKASALVARWLRARTGVFCRAEDGAMTPLTLMMFFLMVLIGGLAIDVMRHERTRVKLQQTLDNSVLAAAARSQALNPKTVVEDYFAKASLSEYLTGVTVDQGMNYRTVKADAKADTKPIFMSLMGVKDFYVDADSAAEEKISNVEVSLVLDISGSMGENGGARINSLRPAARNFVDTIISNSEAGKASISIVPFSTQVNAGANLMAQYTNTPRIPTQNYSSCVEFPVASYASVALPQTLAMNHGGHFDPWGSTSLSSNTPYRFGCSYVGDPSATTITNVSAKNAIMPLSGDATALKSKINGLVIGGNTSIEIGTKWGAAFLDPGTRPVTTALVSAGNVASTYATRPLDYNALETIKALVVMSDGDNTAEYRLKSGYRTGNSNVWKTSGGALYAYHDRASTTSDYWDVSAQKWTTKPAGTLTNLTWPDLFKTYTVSAVAYNFFAKPLGQSTSTWKANILETIDNDDGGVKDIRLQQICSAAKAAGMVVFTISFQAPAGGSAQLKKCATDEAHFYEGDPATISTVFQSIATQIAYLRLTL